VNAVNTVSKPVEEKIVDVVLIDDDKLTLEIVSWILKDTNIRFKLFADHQLALSYLLEVSPRLLIIDFFMPAINGLEFLHSLRKQVDLSKTQIYLCSAVTPRLAEDETAQPIDFELLEKQVICSKPELLAMVDQVCSSELPLRKAG
jgi:PleD family two-component response regulator